MKIAKRGIAVFLAALMVLTSFPYSKMALSETASAAQESSSAQTAVVKKIVSTSLLESVEGVRPGILY